MASNDEMVQDTENNSLNRGKCFKFKIVVEILGTVIILTTLSMIGVIHAKRTLRELGKRFVLEDWLQHPTEGYGNDVGLKTLEGVEPISQEEWADWFDSNDTKIRSVVVVCQESQHIHGVESYLGYIKALAGDLEKDRCAVCRGQVGIENRKKHHVVDDRNTADAI